MTAKAMPILSSIPIESLPLMRSLGHASHMTRYKPLLLLVVFILLGSAAFQVSLGAFDGHLFMNHLMAGFFIGFSFFKLLDLTAFAQSFAGYDPIARILPSYGSIYPFVELSLGLLFLSGVGLPAAKVLTILVLSPTTYGVYQKLRNKGQIECACLGTGFNLPLSNLTIAENLAMIAMAGMSF